MELRDVVRRLKAAQGIRRIHEETGIHRTIIRGKTASMAAIIMPQKRNSAPREMWLGKERRQGALSSL